MDAVTMQKSVQQQLGAMDLPIASEDTVLYLNKAIDKFVKDHFEPRKNRERLGFEQSVKRIEDLRELVKTSEIDTTEVTQKFISGIFADKASIPEDNLLLLSIGLKIFFSYGGIDYTVTGSKREPDGTLDTDYGALNIGAKFIQHDDIYSVLEDPFNKPRITKGIFTIDDGEIYSYTTDEFITDKVVLTYLKKPAQVSVTPGSVQDCDLSETTHEDIVDLAVALYASDRGRRAPDEIQEQEQEN